MNVKTKNPKPYRHVALKLDNEFYDRLHAVAVNADRSVSWSARQALNEWVEAQELLGMKPASVIKRSPALGRAASKRVRGP